MRNKGRIEDGKNDKWDNRHNSVHDYNERESIADLMLGHRFAHNGSGIAVLEATHRGYHWAEIDIECGVAVNVAEDTGKEAEAWEGADEHVIDAHESGHEETCHEGHECAEYCVRGDGDTVEAVRGVHYEQREYGRDSLCAKHVHKVGEHNHEQDACLFALNWGFQPSRLLWQKASSFFSCSSWVWFISVEKYLAIVYRHLEFIDCKKGWASGRGKCSQVKKLIFFSYLRFVENLVLGINRKTSLRISFGSLYNPVFPEASF